MGVGLQETETRKQGELIMAINTLELGDTRQGTGNEVFGIDLGTTYSAIAWLDENGKPTVFRDHETDSVTIPSVVCFESATNITVGESAKNSIATDPEKVVSFIKRHMGDTKFTIDGVDEKGQPKKWTPIEISGLILGKLKKVAEFESNCEVKRVVITCPAYFGTEEHKATRLAGESIGFEVLNVINEPTAAALAYGIKLDEPKTILVYDLGGGTFDVTILKVADERIETVCSGGDQRLGGGDWDRALVDYLVNKWREQTGCQDDILSEVTTLNELMLLAEKNKKLLTSKEKVKVMLSPGGRACAKIEVTREDFDQITNALLERTIVATNCMIADAAKKKGVDKFEFDELIMVGGSTYMPQVAARLEREYGKTPVVFDPNQAVAKGAAVFASIKTAQSSQDPENQEQEEGPTGPVIVNVLSKSYGVVANRGGQKVVFNLLVKQQPQASAKFVQRFGTDVPNQQEIEVQITEGDVGLFVEGRELSKEERIADIEDVTILQKAKLMLPQGLPAHDPVDVTFEIDSDMVLNVSALHVASGTKIDVKVEGVKMDAPKISNALNIE